MSLKQQISDDMKSAMRAGDKAALGTIRLILAALKQIEVDERLDEMTDERVIVVLDKMTKQRRESISQYEKAGRDDLADQEKFEIGIIQKYLPEALDEKEIIDMIESAITETGASSIKDMGKVMGILKPKMQGRTDMGKVSGLIKSKLNG